MSDHESPEWTLERWEREVSRAQLRDDVQEFMQVYNLGNVDLASVRVWFRLLGPDFMAECRLRRPGKKQSRRVFADAPTRSEALEALASKVAGLLHPVKATPTDPPLDGSASD